eukprot:gene18525-22113_t
MVVKDSNPNAGSGDACTANQSIDDGVEDLDDLSDKLLGPSAERVIVQKKTILNRAHTSEFPRSAYTPSKMTGVKLPTCHAAAKADVTRRLSQTSEFPRSAYTPSKMTGVKLPTCHAAAKADVTRRLSQTSEFPRSAYTPSKMTGVELPT